MTETTIGPNTSESPTNHKFVPGDPATGWQDQCAFLVPVQSGSGVLCHCGYGPEDIRHWVAGR